MVKKRLGLFADSYAKHCTVLLVVIAHSCDFDLRKPVSIAHFKIWEHLLPIQIIVLLNYDPIIILLGWWILLNHLNQLQWF